MSFRREPVGVDERIAAIEERLRGLSSRVVVEQSVSSIGGLAAAKGDLFVASAAGVVSRLAVGADGSVLTADSAADVGVAWDASASDALMLAWLGA